MAWAAAVRDQVERVCTRYGLISHHQDSTRGFEYGSGHRLKLIMESAFITRMLEKIMILLKTCFFFT